MTNIAIAALLVFVCGAVARIACMSLFSWLSFRGDYFFETPESRAENLPKVIHMSTRMEQWPLWAWLLAGPIFAPIVLGLLALLVALEIKWRVLHKGPFEKGHMPL